MKFRPLALAGTLILTGPSCTENSVEEPALADPPSGGQPAAMAVAPAPPPESGPSPGAAPAPPGEGSTAAATATAKAGECGGPNGDLSFMAIGKAQCTVQVGSANLGIAPFFKKPVPSGHCPVSVLCPDGQRYSTVLDIPAGGSRTLVVKEDMWRADN